MDQIEIYDDQDSYCVLYQGTHIQRVTKFVGDSQFKREVLFQNLPNRIQKVIIEAIYHDNEPPK